MKNLKYLLLTGIISSSPLISFNVVADENLPKEEIQVLENEEKPKAEDEKIEKRKTHPYPPSFKKWLVLRK